MFDKLRSRRTPWASFTVSPYNPQGQTPRRRVSKMCGVTQEPKDTIRNPILLLYDRHRCAYTFSGDLSMAPLKLNLPSAKWLIAFLSRLICRFKVSWSVLFASQTCPHPAPPAPTPSRCSRLGHRFTNVNVVSLLTPGECPYLDPRLASWHLELIMNLPGPWPFA